MSAGKALAAAALFLGAGCEGTGPPPAGPPPAPGGPVTIVYSAPELFAAQTSIMNGFLRQAGKKGWKVQVANANSDAATQAGQIEYFIDQGAGAVVAVPVDSRSICATIAKADRAGVPFFTVDRAPLGCKVQMSVLSDNFMAGRQAGEAMVELLTHRYGRPRGTVLELQGDLRQNVAQLRGAGFHAAVDGFTEIRVISRETGWISAKVAEQLNLVLQDTVLDGIYMHSDGSAIPVVLPLLDQRGLLAPRGAPGHLFLTGVDATPEALAAIREGFMDQASSQPVFDFGIIADWIEAGLKGREVVETTVVREGALWSPAIVKKADTGWVLLLGTTSVTAGNVADPRLWGNQHAAPPGSRP